MCTEIEKYAIRQFVPIDDLGNKYDVSFLPTLKQEIENEIAQSFLDEKANAEYDDWSDSDYIKFVRKPDNLKFLDNSLDRRNAIINETDGVYFPVCENDSATSEMPWYEFHSLNTVNQYNSVIEYVAKEKQIDADLLRAIVYMESTHGYYDIPMSNLFTAMGIKGGSVERTLHKSILPSNLNILYWGDCFGTREQLQNPENNLFAGATLISRLQKNVGSFNVEKIGTLYNNLAARRINSYGKRVAKFYKDKPWLYQESPYPFISDKTWQHLARGILMTLIEKYPFLLK